MQVDASTLEWHDAGVDRIKHGDATRSMQWETEVFRWDIGNNGDAQPGVLVFEGVESVESHHDLKSAKLLGQVDWEILTAQFKDNHGHLECRFQIHLARIRNSLGGPGYGEVIITCAKAWFVPEVNFLL